MIEAKQDLRVALRAWLLERCPAAARGELRDTTPLIERGILSSLQVVELLLWIEQSTGHPVDLAALVPGSFRDVNTICGRFFEEAP